MRYFALRTIHPDGKPKYWGYPDGKNAQDGKPYGWTTDYELMHLYESEVKMRYAKADVVAKCTDIPAKRITTTEVWL